MPHAAGRTSASLRFHMSPELSFDLRMNLGMVVSWRGSGPPNHGALCFDQCLWIFQCTRSVDVSTPRERPPAPDEYAKYVRPSRAMCGSANSPRHDSPA